MAGHPDEIARLIVKAVALDRPRYRYAAPRHARAAIAAKRWLPERVFDFILSRGAGAKADKVKLDAKSAAQAAGSK